MAEYIKREAAIAIIEEKQKELCPVGRYGRGYVYGSDREKYDAWDEIIDAMDSIPAVDAVVVTRCKDCKHKGWVQEPCHGKSVDYCRVWDCTLRNLESTFCSYGEPKEV